PPWQRFPPQVAPGHSELLAQGWPLFAPPPQVSHMHLSLWKPIARQFGLLALRVRAWFVVRRSSVIGSVPTSPVEAGGQSKLTGPNGLLVPLTVQAMPARGPRSQVPPRHCGHGCATVSPLCTREVSFRTVAVLPDSTLVVPVTGPVTWFVTQTGTPPPISGSG